jgi:hypothetical protein
MILIPKPRLVVVVRSGIVLVRGGWCRPTNGRRVAFRASGWVGGREIHQGFRIKMRKA